jgi:hypothetical protein
MKKILLSIALFLGGISVSNAQFELSNLSIGAGLAPTYYRWIPREYGDSFSGSMLITPMLKVQYEMDEGFVYGDFSMPSREYKYASDLATLKISYTNVNLGYGRYFVGDGDDDFALYGKVGGGISMYTIQTDIPFLNYSQADEDGNWTINVGAGAAFSVSDAIRVFGDLGYAFSSGTYASSNSLSTATYGLGNGFLQLGVRYRFQ